MENRNSTTNLTSIKFRFKGTKYISVYVKSKMIGHFKVYDIIEPLPRCRFVIKMVFLCLLRSSLIQKIKSLIL